MEKGVKIGLMGIILVVVLAMVSVPSHNNTNNSSLVISLAEYPPNLPIDMSQVIAMGEYSSGVSLNDKCIYLALNGFADAGELIPVSNGVLGNVTISLYPVLGRSLPEKVGFFVSTNGDVYVWFWNTRGNDSLVNFINYQGHLSLVDIISKINSFLTDNCSVNIPTSYSDLVSSTKFYIDAFPPSEFSSVKISYAYYSATSYTQRLKRQVYVFNPNTTTVVGFVVSASYANQLYRDGNRVGYSSMIHQVFIDDGSRPHSYVLYGNMWYRVLVFTLTGVPNS